MLPEGVHETTIQEIRESLGFTDRRQELVHGLERYLQVWETHGLLDHVIIDGSFVTQKAEPGDVDILLVSKEGDELLEEFARVATWLCWDREGTKEEFGCEAFPVLGPNAGNLLGWLAFFSHDRQGNVRGLLKLRLPL